MQAEEGLKGDTDPLLHAARWERWREQLQEPCRPQDAAWLLLPPPARGPRPLGSLEQGAGRAAEPQVLPTRKDLEPANTEAHSE